MEVRLAAIVTLGIALAAPLAVAQPQAQLDEAKAHFKSGTELYDENNFRGALVEFQKAYELAPSYKILFNIGQVDMELQDYAGALTAYSRYLREGGPDVPRERVTQVSGEIDRLRGRVGRITIQSAAGAEILVDDVRVGYAPLPEPIAVNAGRHQVTVRVAGHEPQARAVDVAGQEQLTVVLGNELPATVAPPIDHPVLPPKPHGKTRIVVMWSLAGAFAVTSAAFGYLAHSDADDLANLRSTFPVTKAQLDDRKNSETVAAVVADVAGVAALATAGFAVYFTLTRTPAQTDKMVHVGFTPNGAFVAGHF
ncbi:MAG TPA: PEGA domain-containing protein [Kofleriaceae bacterium]|jgi:hypothetical protein|nr:PEGA domain-containing protein [Kofleriaceae bacterium]